MAKPQTTIGTRLHISAGVPATENTTGLAALTWTQCGRVADIAERKEAFDKDSVQDLDTGLTMQVKTFMSPVEFAINLARDTDDAGQVLLRSAYEDKTGSYRFKITHADSTVQYFQGKVFEYSDGALDGKHRKLTVNIGIDGWANGDIYV